MTTSSFCRILCWSSLLKNFYANASSAAGQETLIGIVGRDFVMLGADSSSSSSIAVTASNLDKILLLADPFPAEKKFKRDASEQQAIAAAAAGNAADADRLLGVLQAHVAVREYEASVGCDVECVFHGDKDNPDIDTPMGLDVDAIAHCARKEIASALRSPTPFQLCLLVAGMVQRQDSYGFSSANTSNQMNGPFSNRIRSQINAAKHKINSIPQIEISPPEPKQPDYDEDDTSTLLEPRLIWIDQYGSLQTLEYGAHGFGANFALSILDQGYRQTLSRSEAVSLMKDCFEQLRMRYVINSPQPPCIKCIDSTGCHIM